ncbi:MAG: porin PorA family protein [Nitrosopumilaceae archaeon]
MPIWIFLIVPEVTKLPSTFYHYEEQTGTNSIAPYVGAELPKPFTHRDVQEIKVINIVGKDLKIQSTLRATNTNTGEVFLDESRFFDVDSYTRSHTSVEKGYFCFPPNTQRQNYFLTFPLAFSHAVFAFQGIDIVEGLEVDVYNCQTKPYDISSAISNFEDLPAESFYTCKIWIEPITGKHVNFELQWETFVNDGQNIQLIEKGEKRTDQKYVSLLVKKAKEEKIIYQIYYPIVPIGLLLSGGVILLFSRTMSKKSEKTEFNQNIVNLESLMKKTTNEIVKSSKLISVGKLAANLSNDIRNALQTIATTSIMLQKRKMESLTERDKADFNQIRMYIDKISNQLNDVLDFVKLSPLVISEYSLVNIVDSALERLSVPPTVIINKPIDDVKISCDRMKMESVIIHLLSNALQAVGNDGKITISAQADGDKIIVSIIDSGPGIPPKDLKRIYEPLFTTKPDGTGLGLTVCKNIIDQHNGTIEIQNNPTIVTLSLPLRNRKQSKHFV